MQLDHIMVACADLQQGIDEIAALTGVRAEFGGAHPGAGTCNALLSFGGDQYLEIIAPDPQQPITDGLGAELKAFDRSSIRTWAVAAQGFAHTMKALLARGYGHHIIDMSRTRPDGIELNWQILFATNHDFGNLMPFFIDWQDSDHPSTSSPGGCELLSYTVQLEQEAESYQALMGQLDLDVQVSEGANGMQAALQTPAGRVVLQ